MEFSWPWESFIGTVVGSLVSAGTIYIFIFRETISAKDALIENLREQIRGLERDRLPVVIEEKRILQQDIEQRAKETMESAKVIEEMGVKIRKTTEEIKQVVSDRTANSQALGIIMGAKNLQEVYVEWRLLHETLPASPEVAKFDTYLRARSGVSRARVDTDG